MDADLIFVIIISYLPKKNMLNLLQIGIWLICLMLPALFPQKSIQMKCQSGDCLATMWPLA